MVMSCASNGLLCSDMGHRAPFEAVIRPRNATFRNHPTKTPNPGTCQCRLRNQAVLGLEWHVRSRLARGRASGLPNRRSPNHA